ncbi:unnamed protein product [Diplocarpon coronariae]|nr:hypothetical protein JHW43_005897 [Diplocarpon mali]
MSSVPKPSSVERPERETSTAYGPAQGNVFYGSTGPSWRIGLPAPRFEPGTPSVAVLEVMGGRGGVCELLMGWNGDIIAGVDVEGRQWLLGIGFPPTNGRVEMSSQCRVHRPIDHRSSNQGKSREQPPRHGYASLHLGNAPCQVYPWSTGPAPERTPRLLSRRLVGGGGWRLAVGTVVGRPTRLGISVECGEGSALVDRHFPLLLDHLFHASGVCRAGVDGVVAESPTARGARGPDGASGPGLRSSQIESTVLCYAVEAEQGGDASAPSPAPTGPPLVLVLSPWSTGRLGDGGRGKRRAGATDVQRDMRCHGMAAGAVGGGWCNGWVNEALQLL